jgi:putative membrane protein
MKRYFIGAAVLAAVAGCAGTTQEERSSIVTTTSATLPNQVTVATAIERTPTPRDTETFADDQILALVAVFNTNGIELATLGYERADDARLKRFAKLLVSEHTAARDDEARLSEQLAMRAAPTDRMRSIQLEGTHEVERLKGLSGRAFDTAWLASEASLQRDGLALIDVQLMPSARISEMQAHLADLRDHVDHHLRDVLESVRSTR